MLLGILFLLLISLVGQTFGLDQHGRDLLISMTTYMSLGSLALSGLTSMTGTRFIADMIYSGHEGLVPSSPGGGSSSARLSTSWRRGLSSISTPGIHPTRS